jgi:hypothetical protein
MAELRFDIRGKEGEVSALTFRESIQYAVSLLREFDSALSGKPTGVLSWYIQNLHSNGNLSVLFQSKLKPFNTIRKYPHDVDRAVTSNLVSGFEDIEVKCVTPPYLSEFGLQKVNKLAHLIGKNGATGFHFESQSKGVEVTQSTKDNIGKLLPIARTALGSVEGTLEAINIHGKRPKFIVYHSITNKGVVCLVDNKERLIELTHFLGRHVAVFGTLYKNFKGDTLRVSMDRIKPLDETNRFALPSGEPFQDPEFTNAKSTEEYLRLIRGR